MITKAKLTQARALLPELEHRASVIHNNKNPHELSIKRERAAGIISKLNILLTPFVISLDR